MTINSIFAETILLSDGWAKNVTLSWDQNGVITSIDNEPHTVSKNKAAGPIIPAMHNLHSHAFQRAMAGLSERREKGKESFWSWREIMYNFLAKITAEDVQAIAAQLYLECLKYGYASVGEFHYLHHAIGGKHYDNLAEHSHQIVNAAKATGIALTHLPVLYAYAGFDESDLAPAQARFKTDPEMIMKIIMETENTATQEEYGYNTHVGVAPHSLRAVSTSMLKDMQNMLHQHNPNAPIHIHIAEQMKEVNDCISSKGKRPVELLYDQLSVDERWCLIHATHLTDQEVTQIAKSKAVAGICPTTEGNLGDGIYPMVDFLKQDGRYGVGSDSHVSRSPVEEIRLLEYGQRLIHQARAVCADENTASVGRKLWCESAQGGAQALALNSGELAVGKRADFLVLDDQKPDLYGLEGDTILDAFLFNGNENLVCDTFVAGRQLIKNGQHESEEKITQNFLRTLKKLKSN
ncbi:formimidoylglutamate deiminase [Curvivirga aplysinae]|uniref:formimidoylglutamate deiminase n=1 Tax=Curvivirga aplysinae TaxID=2529852 RepID=UPI0012BD1B0F|nr:formimidoylglutamate deiminase [Curvivirga aplysinae]MTI09071.1 formimidoylglutamate deiminase [Curvivirga aplysinae]